ncbi:MAG TPA: Gfo/Idh/MocA family oxidoreductase [Anaerolineae bacterium]|nr:Gfo/Idh/MocA family oxidoreductase [Anaerolineae bacterium]
MNIGVLGSGFMGGTHARAFAKLPGVNVVAVSSRSIEKARKLGAEVGAAATTDDMAIINDPAIDAVSNTLPTHLHKQYTVAALQAGKHVLVEKPFALHVAECDAMIRAQKKSGKILMIAHVLRFWPEYVALEKFVRSGAIGKPISAVGSRLSQRPAWADWFGNPDLSGGAVLDLLIHDLDALNWIFGKPQTVYARGRETKRGAWDHILAVVDYGKAQGLIEASEFLPPGYPFTMSLEVLCERGRVEFIFRAGGVSVEMGGGASLTAYEEDKAYPLESESGDAYERQIAYFVDCVRQNRLPELGTPAQARLAVAMSNAARESLERSRVVNVARANAPTRVKAKSKPTKSKRKK